MIENYLQVLEESMDKKMGVLCKIEMLCARQEHILSMDPVPEEDFDRSIEEKGVLIDALSKLDEGFEGLYMQIKEQLLLSKEQYKTQIKRLQQKIAEVTEKGVAIQAQEARNKKLAENYFAKEKQELRKGRKSSKAALDYYRNMNKSQMVSSQFMDKKK